VRRRDRRLAEERILDLAAEVCPRLAPSVHVVWARVLPDTYALACVHSSSHLWIVLCEHRWIAEPEERADTVAHELAHLRIDTAGGEELPHGPRWRRVFRSYRRVAREMEWQ
jgi:predicted metallopeptidase